MSRPAPTAALVFTDQPGRSPIRAPRGGDRAQGQAFIVVALTIACSALAIFDLLLLVTTG